MKQKFQRSHYILLSLLLVLTMISSVSLYYMQQLQKETQQVTYQAEAVYQRNFGELADSVQTMNDQLAQLLVTASQEQLLFGLSNLWREVYSAISFLDGLPIATYELEQTDLLLNDVAEYSYYLMRKNVLQQAPLTALDWSQLEDFYRRSSVVQKELDQLETNILSTDFRFASIALEEENLFINTIRNIETQVQALPEVKLEEGVRKIETTPKPIQEPPVDTTIAINNARQFLSKLLQVPSEAIETGSIAFHTTHSQLPIYGVTFPDNHYITVSQNGGHVLQYFCSRRTERTLLTAEEAQKQADLILERLQLENLVCVEQKISSNVANFVFVPEVNGVYLYPDMVKLQIALDDGTLLSFDQTGYQSGDRKRTIPAPKRAADELCANRNPNFQIAAVHLALITDPYSTNELLTYEVRGNIVQQQFAIFVDANTGEEIRIVRL